MDNTTLASGPHQVEVSALRLRAAAVVAALALVFAMFVIVQDRAEAAPAGGSAIAAAVAHGASDAVSAQINFNQILCAILISVRNAFAGSPFFSFVQGILNQLIAGFGCTVSPGA